MNQHPVHIDEHFAAGTQHGQRLVEGPIVISLVIGMSQARHWRPRYGNTGYSDIRHTAPVFHGDTIYAESTVVEKNEQRDRNRGASGIQPTPRTGVEHGAQNRSPAPALKRSSPRRLGR